MKKFILMIIALIPTIGFAQDVNELMMEGDKINVVYAVILVILLGFIGYLFYLDMKVKNVEKKLEEIEK